MRCPPLRIPALVFFSGILPLHAGDVLIQSSRLPDRVVDEVVTFMPVDSGFYPAHAPDRYSTAQLNAALAGLSAEQKAFLATRTERQFAGERTASEKTIVNPNGSVWGIDFSGDPFDPATWLALTTANVNADVIAETTRRRELIDRTFREYVAKPSGSPFSNVNISTWSYTTATDLVEESAPVLRYSPAKFPAFVPAEWVQAALVGAVPGQEVPVARGSGVLDLGIQMGETVETVEPYEVEFGTDYIGDPEDYFTWIAIGASSIQVTVTQETEQGRAFLNQKLSYVLKVPDGTGEVIRNPKHTRRVTVDDVTAAWDKIYFRSNEVPPGLDAPDVAAVLSKLQPGQTGRVVQQRVDTRGDETLGVAESNEAHGAVAGVDYAGNPANPATWTALTAEDVIVDRVESQTLTTEVERLDTMHQLYVESGGGPGEVKVIHNDVISRDIIRVNEYHLDRELDLGKPPSSIDMAEVFAALAWAEPRETVVVASMKARTLLSTDSVPMPEVIDTNRWILGVDFTGPAGQPSLWTATGPDDVYIDIYHPVTRTRVYDERVTHFTLTAPAQHVPRPRVSEVLLQPITGETNPGLSVGWRAPAGMKFGIEVSSDLSLFTPVDRLIYGTGDLVRYLHSGPAGQAFSQRQFARVRRR